MPTAAWRPRSGSTWPGHRRRPTSTSMRAPFWRRPRGSRQRCARARWRLDAPTLGLGCPGRELLGERLERARLFRGRDHRNGQPEGLDPGGKVLAKPFGASLGQCGDEDVVVMITANGLLDRLERILPAEEALDLGAGGLAEQLGR